MEDFVARVVQRLRQEPGFSRNRHFMAFSSPEGRRALRIHRHLRSIESDLSRGAEGTVERAGERLRVTLRSKASVRMAWLTEDEFRILCTSPIARAALAGTVQIAAQSRASARDTTARSAARGSGPT